MTLIIAYILMYHFGAEWWHYLLVYCVWVIHIARQ